MIYLGVDWAEKHHDVCLIGEDDTRLASTRVPDGANGLYGIQELVSRYADDATAVVVGIETDRGLLVQGLIASGYTVYAINPYAVSRYRDRHTTSGAKSDLGDVPTGLHLGLHGPAAEPGLEDGAGPRATPLTMDLDSTNINGLVARSL